MKLVIKARAEKAFEPDWMNFTVQCMGFDSSDRTESTKKMLENIKKVMDFTKKYFAPELTIETSDISVHEEYDYKQKKSIDEFGDVNYEQEKLFSGYKSRQTLKFAQAIDVELTLKTIIALSEKDNISVNVNYSLHEKDKFQKEVLTLALDLAREKAETIAGHLNKTNIECTLVDYVNTTHINRSDFDIGGEILCLNTLMEGDYEDSEEFSVAEELAEVTKPESISLTEEVQTNFEIG